MSRERQLRLQAEKERDDLERKFLDYQQQMKQIHETLVCLFDSNNLFIFVLISS